MSHSTQPVTHSAQAYPPASHYPAQWQAQPPHPMNYHVEVNQPPHYLQYPAATTYVQQYPSEPAPLQSPPTSAQQLPPTLERSYSETQRYYRDLLEKQEELLVHLFNQITLPPQDLQLIYPTIYNLYYFPIPPLEPKASKASKYPGFCRICMQYQSVKQTVKSHLQLHLDYFKAHFGPFEKYFHDGQTPAQRTAVVHGLKKALSELVRPSLPPHMRLPTPADQYSYPPPRLVPTKQRIAKNSAQNSYTYFDLSMIPNTLSTSTPDLNDTNYKAKYQNHSSLKCHTCHLQYPDNKHKLYTDHCDKDLHPYLAKNPISQYILSLSFDFELLWKYKQLYDRIETEDGDSLLDDDSEIVVSQELLDKAPNFPELRDITEILNADYYSKPAFKNEMALLARTVRYLVSNESSSKDAHDGNNKKPTMNDGN